jgi:hypothetical protein
VGLAQERRAMVGRPERPIDRQRTLHGRYNRGNLRLPSFVDKSLISVKKVHNCRALEEAPKRPSNMTPPEKAGGSSCQCLFVTSFFFFIIDFSTR